jgi:hypothetical protein
VCFSASASFAAAGVTGIAGVAALARSQTPGQRLVAVIPLGFAVQQLAEGILWLSLSGSVPPEPGHGALYAFQGIAEIFWPLWVPLAVRALEIDRSRRLALSWFLGLGTAVAIVQAVGLTVFPTSAGIAGGHIQYRLDGPMIFRWSTDIPYILVTALPPLLSSSKPMRIVGALVLASFGFAKLFFYATFISVWCFFAAWTSALLVLLILRAPPVTAARASAGRR